MRRGRSAAASVLLDTAPEGDAGAGGPGAASRQACGSLEDDDSPPMRMQRRQGRPVLLSSGAARALREARTTKLDLPAMLTGRG